MPFFTMHEEERDIWIMIVARAGVVQFALGMGP